MLDKRSFSGGGASMVLAIAVFMSSALIAPLPAQETDEARAVLITGTSSGIGLRMTEVLSENGFFVYAGARDAEDLARLDAMENVKAVRLDVTVQSEIDAKAAKMKDRIVIPKKTKARGKKLVALVKASDLGGAPAKGWGYQVIMQSNEGYPEPTDLLTRQVNEYEGPHRFGGGNDYYMDPHVIDMLGGPDVQYPALSAFKYDEEEEDDESKWVLAIVPMVYPK